MSNLFAASQTPKSTARHTAVWQAERLKLRHSFLPKLAWALPLLGALYFLLIWALGSVPHTWSRLPGSAYNGWVFLILPLGAALLAGLDDLMERRADYGGLLYRPVAPAHTLLARFAALAEALLWAHLVFALTLVVAGWISAHGPVPLLRLLTLSVLPWLMGLPLLAVALVVARRFGWLGALLSGLGLFSAVLAETGAWWASPWAWAMRASIPYSGTSTNGEFLPSHSALWHLSPLPPLLLAAVFSAVLLWWAGRAPQEN